MKETCDICNVLAQSSFKAILRFKKLNFLIKYAIHDICPPFIQWMQ